jgi:Uma2 family endonuclease
MPTKSHQKIARFVCNQLLAYLEPRRLGDAVTAPYRVRMPDGSFREPDVVAYLQEHLHHFGERFGEGADLVVEIVSEGKDSRERDLDVKPSDYAKAGISEYWIIDPQEANILVLQLHGDAFQKHGPFRIDEEAPSILIPGFRLSVRDVFAAGGDV